MIQEIDDLALMLVPFFLVGGRCAVCKLGIGFGVKIEINDHLNAALRIDDWILGAVNLCVFAIGGDDVRYR